MALKFSAAIIALFISAIHLEWGLDRLLWQLEAGIVHDPRPALFVVSAIAIVIGLTLRVINVGNTRLLYLGGIVMMCAYLLGYLAWHSILGHGSFWPWNDHVHYHDSFTLAILAEHLKTDAVAGISKFLELVLLVILLILYHGDTEPDGVTEESQ